MNELRQLLLLSKRLMVYIIIGAILGGIGGIFYAKAIDSPKEGVVIFTSFGLTNSSSASGDSNIVETTSNMTEGVLGWILDPHFQNAVRGDQNEEISISSQKQEKNNLLTTITSYDRGTVRVVQEQFITEIQESIDRFNEGADIGLNLAFYNVSEFTDVPNSTKNMVIGTILGMLAIMSIVILYELGFGIISINYNVKNILKKDMLAEIDTLGSEYIEQLASKQNFSTVINLTKWTLANNLIGKLEDIDSKSKILILCQNGYTKENDIKKVAGISKNIEWLSVI